jgi:hypothetical protein
MMATLQAIVFGIMLALTPSMVLVAFLLLRDRTRPGDEENTEFLDVCSSEKLKFDDQPPYPNTQ